MTLGPVAPPRLVAVLTAVVVAGWAVVASLVALPDRDPEGHRLVHLFAGRTSQEWSVALTWLVAAGSTVLAGWLVASVARALEGPRRVVVLVLGSLVVAALGTGLALASAAGSLGLAISNRVNEVVVAPDGSALLVSQQRSDRDVVLYSRRDQWSWAGDLPMGTTGPLDGRCRLEPVPEGLLLSCGDHAQVVPRR